MVAPPEYFAQKPRWETPRSLWAGFITKRVMKSGECTNPVGGRLWGLGGGVGAQRGEVGTRRGGSGGTRGRGAEGAKGKRGGGHRGDM